ncbi:MAG TPA: DUF222 domain-containing protein [Acidothermaceae bacterium]
MLLTMPTAEAPDVDGVDVDLDAPAGSFVSWVLELPPGPESMAMLCSLDAETLPADERVLVLQAWERQHAWLSAQVQAAVVAAAGPEPTTADDWAKDEVAAALRLSIRSAHNKVHLARVLTEELPGVTRLLDAGEVTFRHALAAVELCAGLPRDAVAKVEQRVLPKAPDQSIAQFRRSVRRAVLAVAPEQAEEAMQDALADDVDVRVHPLPNGMAELVATLPALEARELFLAVNTLAKARHAAAGGKRSGVRIGRRRVDVLAALARAALSDRTLPRTHGRRAELQVVIDLPTLLRLQNNPAELAGHGPIHPEAARALAGDAAWRRLVIDPVTGHLLDYGVTTYRPPQALVDYITARDRTCCFPGCENPACGCDLDHAVNHPVGATSAINCGLLCRRHHRLKTFRPWKIKRHSDGSVTWRSAAGLLHHVPPKDQRDP